MRIDISREAGVLDAVASLESADAGVQVHMMETARTELIGAWLPALQARVQDEQDRKMIMGGASALVGATGFLLQAAQSSVPLSNGLIPSMQYYASEFGARTRRATITGTSPKGKRYQITKMLNRGLPSRQKHGRIAFDAASEVGTEIVRVWIRVLVEDYRAAVGDETRG